MKGSLNVQHRNDGCVYSSDREGRRSTLAIVDSQARQWPQSELLHWLKTWDYGRLLQRSDDSAKIRVSERFDWGGEPLDPGFRRVRVLGRQAYVLCHAAIGGNEAAKSLAPVAISALLDHGIGDEGQFHSRLDPFGKVVDNTADLYDIAFGLFALAWWYRLSGDKRAPAVAERSVALVRAHLGSPAGHGFLARAGDSGPHQQNPHMHLFEAAIFLAAFTGKQVFSDLADELFDLVERALYDPVTATLAEFFDSEWRPIASATDNDVRIEPGHHYEWVWLLSRYGALAGQSRAFAIADRLFDFARRNGHDPMTGLVLDAVTLDGSVIAPQLRIWPNTELLKAQITMRERHGSGAGFDESAIAANVARIREHFLAPSAFGPAARLGDRLWIDHLERDGVTPRSDHVPASTLYHIVFGFTELTRHSAGHAPFSGLPW